MILGSRTGMPRGSATAASGPGAKPDACIAVFAWSGVCLPQRYRTCRRDEVLLCRVVLLAVACPVPPGRRQPCQGWGRTARSSSAKKNRVRSAGGSVVGVWSAQMGESGVWTMTTLCISDWVVLGVGPARIPLVSAGSQCFAGAGVRFESHLGHVFPCSGAYGALSVHRDIR